MIARVGAGLAVLLLAIAGFKASRSWGGTHWPQAEFDLFVTFLLSIALLVAGALAANVSGDYAVAIRRGVRAGDEILQQGTILGYVGVAVMTVATIAWIALRR
ncbi:hypothetical protein WPS_34520 [Vulcanimicrobium alpinum]|uniref:Uncharacterized protein n=1 Tax=Vulcanimicrobium alpinum TaxID=3016050 RepID=A0AAN1XZF2_UNVUL|nr:hypothetical protein [Vulcanimicrobium alpinum]BDE08176.1 hypothetical protein WPS_34520 [Vulcanimicrobium alpinum]